MYQKTSEMRLNGFALLSIHKDISVDQEVLDKVAKSGHRCVLYYSVKTVLFIILWHNLEFFHNFLKVAFY